jgi:hypothetical protein
MDADWKMHSSSGEKWLPYMFTGLRAAAPPGSPTVIAGGVTFRIEGLSSSLITNPVSAGGEVPKPTKSGSVRAMADTGERKRSAVLFTRTALRTKPGGISTVIERPSERGNPIPRMVIQRGVWRAATAGVAVWKMGCSKSIT